MLSLTDKERNHLSLTNKYMKQYVDSVIGEMHKQIFAEVNSKKTLMIPGDKRVVVHFDKNEISTKLFKHIFARMYSRISSNLSDHASSIISIKRVYDQKTNKIVTEVSNNRFQDDDLVIFKSALILMKILNPNIKASIFTCIKENDIYIQYTSDANTSVLGSLMQALDEKKTYQGSCLQSVLGRLHTRSFRSLNIVQRIFRHKKNWNRLQKRYCQML